MRAKVMIGGERLRRVSEICRDGELNPARGTDRDVATTSRLFARRYKGRQVAPGQEVCLARKHSQTSWEGEVAGVGYGLSWQRTMRPQICP